MIKQQSSHSTYILEVGYNKVYKRTYHEQINILKNYQPPEKFRNTWKRSIMNIAGGVTRFTVASGLAIVGAYKVYSLEVEKDLKKIEEKIFGKAGLYAYSAAEQALSATIINKLVSHVIPILPANQYSDGILFIPGNNAKFIPQEKNSMQNKNSDIIINIKPKDFDPIIHDIANEYHGELLTKDTEKSSHENIYTIMYKFVDTKEQPIETQIKRFLYSLPVNVFLMSIYKVDGKNQNQKKEKEKEKENKNALLFPRNNNLKNNTIDDSSLSRADKKIIEYGETQIAIYNKLNKNVKYLIEYIKPLRFFKNLLPKQYRVPEFSPMT